MSKNKSITRRSFLEQSAKASAALTVFSIVPASVFGKNAPSNRINVGAIGTGRISRVHDLPGIWKSDLAQIVAVCDLDSKRADEGRILVNEYYTKKNGKPFDGVKAYTDYQEMLLNKDIDAVVVSTPDHQHARIAVHAARAKKHIYLQKPTSLTIAEGRTMADEVTKAGVIFQIGSQQRSSTQFRYAAELVRNGRIGKLKTVYVGLPGDPSGEEEPEMPIPKNLNYDAWLGSTPYAYYTEKRVHPQQGYDRPGWLRCEQFGAGMITGWGAHHIDSAHWGMDTEYTSPVEIWGEAQFPTKGLWDVHGIFRTEALYDNGVKMVVSNELPNGIKFEGSDGWVWVTRGNYNVTGSDPVSNNDGSKPLDASDPKIIKSVIGPKEVHLYESADHHVNWLESIQTKKKPITNVEIAHRVCSTCLLHHIAMKVKRKVYWDPKAEKFKNDEEANKMLSRPQRDAYALAK
ncbi:MAG TPA: Gfo/Idh/MocA family oxidoreductase [Cyclobacteriaceae bacterium]|nr:Gfo/Idh/MocA family oxidoreductase [Cyclobacteriaceae bacterium]